MRIEMTPRERALVSRFRRKLAEFSPDLAALLTDAWDEFAASIDMVELVQLIATGDIDHIVAQILGDEVLDAALSKVRYQIRLQVDKAVTWSAADLPKRAAAGRAAISFDVLNENHITAVRTLTTKVMMTLKGDARESVRMFVETGIRAGAGPREIARHIRDIVGLAPNQVEYIANLEAALRSGDLARVRQYKMLDKRFNLERLTPDKIDSIVESYRKSWVSLHSETVARTATMDTLRLGQKLSIDDAVEKGFLDGSRLMKAWVQVDRPNKRESHAAMNGEVVPHDANFSNGDFLPGDGDPWNCACLPRYFESREKAA